MTPGSKGLVLFGSFSAAVFLAVYLLPAPLWPWLGLALLLPAGLLLVRRVPAGTLVCLGLAAGLLWCGAFRAVFFGPAQDLDGTRSQVTFYLSESAVATDYGAGVSGWVVQPGKAPVQATLYAGKELLELGPGDRVTTLADCAQTALREEARFTSRATRGIFLRLIARDALEVSQPRHAPWWALPRLWQEAMAGSIRALFPQDVSGLLAAMTVGDRSGLAAPQRADLTRSGISHLVALSGMHVSFLVGFLTLFTGYYPRRRAAVCIPVVVLFTLAVGASPSILRACCFQLALLVADLLGRETYRWSSLLATLALLLLLDPFSAANVSLQLSFAAVAGIGLISPRLMEATASWTIPGRGRAVSLGNAAVRFLRRVLSVTLGAMAFTVPICAFYFGAVSLAAPLTNLLVLPVAALLFAGTLCAALLGLVFPAGAALLAIPLTWTGRYVLAVARLIAQFPYSAVTLTEPYYPAALLGIYALVLLGLLWRSQRRRVWLFLLCGGTMLAGSVLFTHLTFRTAPLTVSVLDVGQGQSVVLTSGGQVAVIDCGGNSYEDPGDLCADCLGNWGRTRVDKLILTHYDSDHTNGLSALFRRLDVREVILPRLDQVEPGQLRVLELAQAEGAAVRWLTADQRVPLGRAELRLYAPVGGGSNQNGLSALIQAGDFHMLLTGDMSQTAEERLLRRVRLPRCQVLVAGHHGSRYASGDALLNAVRPENAVISVGFNSYGHPAQDTLDRLAHHGVKVYRTDRSGAVTIRVR